MIDFFVQLLQPPKRRLALAPGLRRGARVVVPPIAGSWRTSKAGAYIPAALFFGLAMGIGTFARVARSFISSPGQALLVVAAIGIYGMWRFPLLGTLVVIYGAATFGGPLILLAAPAVVLLARGDSRRSLAIPRTPKRTAITLGVAALAFLATLPFADQSFGPWSDRNNGRPQTRAAPSGLRDPTGDSIVARVLNAISDFFRPSDTGEQVSESSPVPLEEETSVNWILIILILLVVLLVAVVVAVLVRRFRNRRGGSVDPEGAAGAMSLARLEAIGALVGRRRRSHEGPITFASALADHTADRRLAEVGPLVSGAVYESQSADPQLTAQSLGAVEEVPPPKPPEPPRRERWRSAALARLTSSVMRDVGLLLVVAVAIVGIVVAVRAIQGL